MDPWNPTLTERVFRDVDLVFDVDVLLDTDDVALTNEGVQRVLLPKVQLKLQRPRRELVAAFKLPPKRMK